MQRRHKTLLAVGAIIFLLAWFAWSVLLTESDEAQPPVVQQPN